MTQQSAMSRRTLLKTFAGLAGTASFEGLLGDAFAASASAPPLRFIVLWSPHGCAPDLWRPRAPDGGTASVTGWTLDYDPQSSLGPLEKHKSSLVIIEGLDLTTNYTNLSPILTGHAGGCVAPLTGLHGRSTDESLRTTGPSIDHVVASALQTKQFLFLPLGYEGNHVACSYDKAGEQIPFEFDLRQSFTTWFGSFTTPATDPKAVARKAAAEGVLTYLRADANKLRARLAGPERLKMDAHLDALALVEQRLSQTAGTSACAKPPAKPATLTNDPTYMQTIMTFAVQLLACNLTRVVTLSLDVGRKMPWVGLGDVDMHNDIAHGYRPDDPASARRLSTLQRWYATQVAFLLDQLKAIPEGNGTLHDSTIILWANELGDPARHMNNNLPFVVAGGGGTFPKGRYLQLGIGPEYSDTQDPHNHLLTSIANQFGLGLSSFGDPAYPGELPGFLG